MLIIILALMILFLFLLAYLCKNVFVPLIGRLKNRMLVEEAGLDTSKEKGEKEEPVPLEPPPSSDRQQIRNMDAAPETE